MINPEAAKPDEEIKQRIADLTELLRQDRSPDENRATWAELVRLDGLLARGV